MTNLSYRDTTTTLTSVCRGVAVYIKDNLTTNATLIDLGIFFTESLWVELKLDDHNKVTLGCVYRSRQVYRRTTYMLCNIVTEVNNRCKSKVMIVGDFNFPEIDWDTETTPKSNTHSS